MADGNGANWMDSYRDMWKWDRVTWGSHCVDCYPSNCSWRVYTRDGKIVREEQSGNYETIERGVPDMNPMGCQKGASWSQLHYGKERVLYPLKRAGERGEGKWERISWDQAFNEIADGFIDTIQDTGPESIIRIGEPAEGGTQVLMFGGSIISRLGGLSTDIQAEINDFSPGIYVTFGKFDPAASVDDWFHTELTLIWQLNPVYTNIPWYHFVAEARYNGGEVVLIAPDYSPSAIHTDTYVPVRCGADPALALAMCKVIIDEGIYNKQFVQEQTDLPFLVRSDSKRFLRQSDLQAGGRDDQFYWFDNNSKQIVEAPRGTLALADRDPALEGVFKAKLADGTEVEVTPVFEILKKHLEDYTPEKAQASSGTHPDIVRDLARKTARMTTRCLMGWNSGKYYHGDLMERSMMLLLGLTGNWGKKGAGARSWAVGMFDGMFMYSVKGEKGPEGARRLVEFQKTSIAALKAEDPTMTDEIAIAEADYRAAQAGGMVPPVFFWYYHCGYREVYNNREWGDPTMKRAFDDYLEEGIQRGWYDGFRSPDETKPPRIIWECGSNFMRRTRGGQDMLVKHLLPKVKMLISVDWRMSTTGLWSDYILPAAHHYEKDNFCYTTPHILNLTYNQKAVDPPGEAKEEWDIALGLAKALVERGKARGFEEYTSHIGLPIRFQDVANALTANGQYKNAEEVLDEMIRDTAVAGTLPADATLDKVKEKGWLRFVDWGRSRMAIAQSSDLKPDETHSPFRWHTEKKYPFPTMTRRAQFYIDHEWFLEGGEELPTHKETPNQGGDYPFVLTSGHPRWSIHSMNMTNKIMLNTHRGVPFVYMNPGDAKALGVNDHDDVRLYNDASSMICPVRISPGTRPGMLVIYNGFEPYQFKQWKDPANVEPGMVKWLHLAGGYGHLRYSTIHWQPVPIDRAIKLAVEKVGPEARAERPERTPVGAPAGGGA